MTDGAMNGDLFVAEAEQVLAPTLRPSDIIVVDNLSSHKRVATVRVIEQAGERWRICRRPAPTPTSTQ